MLLSLALVSVLLLKAVPTRSASDEPIQMTLTVREGESVELDCNVTGTSAPLVDWFRRLNNSYVWESMATQAEVLTLSDVIRYEDYEYKCNADNGLSSELTRHFKVDVVYPPVVIVFTPEVRQVQWDDAVLKCEALSHGDDMILQWRRNKRVIYENSKCEIEVSSEGERKMSTELTIKSVKQVDYGEYECFSENSEGRDSKLAIVSESVVVTMAMSNNDRTPEVSEGDGLRLICDVSAASEGSDDIVMWYRGPLGSGNLQGLEMEQMEETGRELLVKNLAHSEDFMCVVSNDTESPVFFVISVHVLYPPEVTVLTPMVIQSPGNNATLQCSVTSQEAFSSLDWLHDGHILYEDEKYRTEVDDDSQREVKVGTLTIVMVTEEDYGEYMCMSVNSEGTSIKTAILSEESPVMVDMSLQTGTLWVAEDRTLLLVCNVTTDPSDAVFVWYRRHVRSGDVESLTGQQTLEVDSVTRGNDYVYLCIVDSGGPPAITHSISVYVVYPPEVTVMVSQVNGTLGENATLQCQANGYGDHAYMSADWQHDGHTLHHNSSHHIMLFEEDERTLVTVLTITSIREEDFGDYQCVFMNSEGSDSKTVTLIGRYYNEDGDDDDIDDDDTHNGDDNDYGTSDNATAESNDGGDDDNFI